MISIVIWFTLVAYEIYKGVGPLDSPCIVAWLSTFEGPVPSGDL